MSNNIVGKINSRVGEITNIVGKTNGRMGEMSQTVNSYSQSIVKLKTQVKQMANTLNKRKKGKLPGQSVANPKGLYMANEEASPHQHVQSITTLRSEKLVDNQVENKKDEHTEISETLQRDKGKQVINDTSSSADPNSKAPYVPRAPFPEWLKVPSHFGKQGEKIQAMMEVFKQVKINIPLLDAI